MIVEFEIGSRKSNQNYPARNLFDLSILEI